MVIGKIGAENNQKLGADEVRQRAGRRTDAQCRFEPGNTGGVTKPRTEIYVVGAEHPREFLEDVIHFIGQPA